MIRYIGRSTIDFLTLIGSFVIFTIESLIGLFHIRILHVYKQIINIGVLSLPVVGMTAIFSGAVLALQSYNGFTRFSAESSVATVVVLSITRELGPVLAGLMVSGRVGASIAAEIGTMRVTEQIDALYTMSINPIKYLVSPRLIASLICLPILVLIADIIGVMGGYIVSVYKLGFNDVFYITNTFKYLRFSDVLSGLIKAFAFGGIISLVSSYNGYYSTKGAQGVGKATTNAVVYSSIMILISNYIITQSLGI